MKINHKYVLGFIALSIVALGISTMPTTEANDKAAETENDSISNRRQLRRSFFQKREVLVVYGASSEALANKYRALLEELANTPMENSRRNVSVSFKDASNVNQNELRENIVFLVGTPNANPFLKSNTQNIPVEFDDNKFLFDTKKYVSEDMLVSVGFYPNPQNDTLPISFLSGNDEAKVFDFFKRKVEEEGRSFYRQNMDYEIYQGTSRIVMGDFSPDWKLEASTKFDYSSGNALVHTSKHFDFVSHQDAISTTDVLPLAKKVEQTTADILNFVGSSSEIPKITYHIYKSSEEKGLMTGNTNQAHFDSLDNSAHTIINEKYANNFIEKENALLINSLLGTSKAEALQFGLPVYFTKQWQREGYTYWSARLFESGNALSLGELLNNETLEIESPLIADCMSASLIGFLVERWGKKTFLERYANWIPTEKEIKELETGWQKYLSENTIKNPKKERISPGLPYQKGFNFAHEGYSIYNGYGGIKAAEALTKMKSLGSNAMAIVPYSFIQDKNQPMPFRFSDNAGSENDESVVHSSFEAKKLGMTTVLKPQVFAGDSWPGDVEMLNEKDWESFFDYYHKWIRHYAFLAEIHQMDVLCVGTEFAKATLSHEEDWRNIFRSLRGLYQGKLTYASNWGAEFEKVGFWDELDFIGLNCYYPLSKNDNPDKAELKANFDSVKVKIEKVYAKFKKPIVFTEIGFRSIDAPWKSPHAEGDDSFNPAHQQLCYEVVFEGIKDEPWCGGILWWKFPSYLEYRGIENSAFTPNNKKAEETIKRWFLKAR